MTANINTLEVVITEQDTAYHELLKFTIVEALKEAFKERKTIERIPYEQVKEGLDHVS